MNSATSRFAPLDPASTEPLYRQIYNRFRGAITEGLLKPGDRIPSARALTTELGLARGTIDAAYSLLAAEGYIQARGQAGTVVTPGLILPAPPTRQDTVASRSGKKGTPIPLDTNFPSVVPIVSAWAEKPERENRSIAAPGGKQDAPREDISSPGRDKATRAIVRPGDTFRAQPPTILPFQMGLPALDAFPRKIWARLGARCARAMQPADMAYPPLYGTLPLRRQIAAYLQVSRGIACSPSQIIITSGYRHTLELIVRALLKTGDKVWLEDPGYPPTRELLAYAQLRGVPVPVDEDGIVVAQGVKRAPRAKAAVVTPSHQSPLCVSLALPRRLALLDWAARNDAWIVEDDYDGEYRYVSRPLPALKSLDRDGRVLYAGTFSKVLFPSIRLAYLVVPESLVERFEQISQVFSGGTPALTQAIVTAFITEGHFARHIQRMRKLYAERREATAAGLTAVLGRHLQIDPQPGGMHLVLRLKGRRSDRALAHRIRENGMYAHALGYWAIEDSSASALLLNFTNVDSRETAEKLGGRILDLI